MGPQENSKTTSASSASGSSISGTIEFQDASEPALNVTVHVRLQDVRCADTKALTVAEQVIRGVNISPGAPPIPFTLHDIPKDPDARYVVRVHADVNADGAVSPGDYVSMQSYPVETSDETPSLRILARYVG